MASNRRGQRGPLASFVLALGDEWMAFGEAEEKIVESFLAWWDSVKKIVAQQCREAGVETMRLEDVCVSYYTMENDENLQTDFVRILLNMQSHLRRTGRYAELMDYARDMLSLFDWSDDPQHADTFHLAVGEALEGLGRGAERDAYFQAVLAEGTHTPFLLAYTDKLLSERGQIHPS